MTIDIIWITERYLQYLLKHVWISGAAHSPEISLVLFLKEHCLILKTEIIFFSHWTKHRCEAANQSGANCQTKRFNCAFTSDFAYFYSVEFQQHQFRLAFLKDSAWELPKDTELLSCPQECGHCMHVYCLAEETKSTI